MLSVVGSAFLLPFLPMAPVQILLNNLLYDISQTGIPLDNVDAEAIEKPQKWDVGLIRRFMTRIGPVSSLFDYATFGLVPLPGPLLTLDRRLPRLLRNIDAPHQSRLRQAVRRREYMMNGLLDALKEGRLVELPEGCDKETALEFLANIIEAIPDIGATVDLMKSIAEREAQANTGIGRGAWPGSSLVLCADPALADSLEKVEGLAGRLRAGGEIDAPGWRIVVMSETPFARDRREYDAVALRVD